jgi:hypothetical protein
MNNQPTDKQCSIVVSSCDPFDDVWSPFFQLLFKYWTDCPFPIYLITNHKSYSDPRVHVIKVGEDKLWASNLQFALNSITTPYILYLQEDYFLRKKVDTKKIFDLLRHMQERHVSYLRLVPAPSPDEPWPQDSDLGIIAKNAPYRVSLQASFWNRALLEKLLIPGETGWDMEEKGSVRSDDLPDVFLSSKRKRFFDYYPATAIKRGKWLPGALALCRREGISVDISKRKVLSRRRILIGKIRGSRVVQAIRSIVKKNTFKN